MGGKILSGTCVTDVRNIPFDRLDQLEDLCYRKVWKDRLTQVLYEEYTVFDTANTSLQEEYDIYEKRRLQELNLVKVLYVQNIHRELGGSWCKEFKVFTEHIPILVSQIEVMGLSTALYFLKKAFIGYETLYKEIGFFDVSQNMMGVNDQYQPKVWLNGNWALNKPTSKIIGSANKIFLQRIMVQQIFDIIEKLINYQQMQKYINQKKNVLHWSFELAHHFISNFTQIQKIVLPNKVSFVRKMSQKTFCQISKKQIIGQKSGAKINLSIDIPPSNYDDQGSLPSARKMFSHPGPQQSPHYKYETLGVLSFKQKSQIFSPHSNAQSFNFDGRIKRSELIRDPRANDSTRNISRRKHCLSNFYDFSAKKQSQTPVKFEDSKGKAMKSSKANSFLESESHIIVKNNIEDSRQMSNDRRMKTQSAILKTQLPQFKALRTLQNPNDGHSSITEKKSKTSELDITQIDNTVKASTVDSNEGFSSPTAKSRNPLSHNFDSSAKNWLVLSQQLNVPSSQFEQAFNKSSQTGSPYPLSNEPKQSDIIAESIEQVTDFLQKAESPKLSKQRMSQSITINQLMEQPKRSDKPLSMLDMYVSKKTVQKLQKMPSQQRHYTNQTTNNLALSIIEPEIQQSFQEQI